MIPERVFTVTSVTTLRSKTITTPDENFSYQKVPAGGFDLGVEKVELDDGNSLKMATAEKALADMLITDRLGGLKSLRDMRAFLMVDLRIEPIDLRDWILRSWRKWL